MPVRGQGEPVGALVAVAASEAITLFAVVAVEEADPALSGEDPEHAARAAEVTRNRAGNFVIDFKR